MDTQERHELKQNDLEEFLRNFKEWWSKNQNTVLAVIAIAAICFMAFSLWTSHSERVHEEAWSTLAMKSSPETHRQLALSHDNRTIRMLAALRGADGFLAEANEPAESISGTNEASQDTLNKAEELYQLVIDEAEFNEYRINALFGLAAVAENRHNWEQARNYYQQVIETAGPGLSFFSKQAESRMAMLTELATPVAFAPEPEPKVIKEFTITTPPAPENAEASTEDGETEQ